MRNLRVPTSGMLGREFGWISTFHLGLNNTFILLPGFDLHSRGDECREKCCDAEYGKGQHEVSISAGTFLRDSKELIRTRIEKHEGNIIGILK